MKKVIGLVFVIVMAFSVGYLVKDHLPTLAGVNQSANEVITSTETEPIGGIIHTKVNESPDSNDDEELLGEISCLEEQIDELIDQKIDLETNVAQLTSELKETTKHLDTTQEENQNMIKQFNEETQELETEILRNMETITFLDTRRDELEAELDEQRNTNYQQLQQITTLEDMNRRILDIRVTQHYEWVYGNWLWKDRYQWDLSIPLSLYWSYREQPRPTQYREWIDMAKDPGDNSYIDTIVTQINNEANEEGFTESEKVKFVIRFVQSLPYTVDSVTTPWNEYPRYPIETLFDRGGDCEDTSILVAALLNRLGYDTALLLLPNEQHAAVGVSITGVSGSYYTKDGVKYYYVETTGTGYEIGEIPEVFTRTSAFIYPLDS